MSRIVEWKWLHVRSACRFQADREFNYRFVCFVKFMHSTCRRMAKNVRDMKVVIGRLKSHTPNLEIPNNLSPVDHASEPSEWFTFTLNPTRFTTQVNLMPGDYSIVVPCIVAHTRKELFRKIPFTPFNFWQFLSLVFLIPAHSSPTKF